MKALARIGLATVILAAVLLAGVRYLADREVSDLQPIIGARPTQNGVLAIVVDRDYALETSGPMDSDIYLVEGDGTGLRQITDTPDSEFSPAFSPDGSRLAFLRGWFCDCRPNMVTSVVVVGAAGGAERFAAEVPPGYAANLEWAPDGRSILAHWQEQDGGWSTASVDLATGQWRELGHGLTSRISWSPDGRWLLVATADLFAVPADALGDGPITAPAAVAGARQLTHTQTDESAGTWAPDSLSVIFVSHDVGGTSVMAVDIEDGRPRVLAADGFSPAWSPDGRQASYMRVEGPRFSPDTVFDPEGGEVWIVNADGTDAHPVASSFTPARWSPNSDLLYLFGTEGMATVDTADPDMRVALMPPEFSPTASDILWLSALEQYDGAYGHQGGADWQATR